jgi:hypothetical protein
MSLEKMKRFNVVVTFLAAFVLAQGFANAADEQVRSEGVVVGSEANDDSADGVIVPDLQDNIKGEPGEPDVAFTDWVSPVSGRDFQTIGFLPRGGLLVRDGTVYREFLQNGSEKISKALPVDCTKLRFDSPKGQGVQDTFLGDCTASVVRNDNTMRICGSVKGQGLKCIAYDLDNPGGACSAAVLPATIDDAEARICEAVRTTAEPPPQLADALSDDSDFVELRWPDAEPRILFAGDRKSIFAIRPTNRPIALDSEDSVETVFSFNGTKINSFTPLREKLIVAFETGELRSLDLATGVDQFLYQHPTLCGDRKTKQGFNVRSDPDENYILALNRACGTLTVLDANGTIIDTDGDGTAEPFLFNNSGTTEPEFLGDGVIARSGESGTFEDCEIGEVCQLGQRTDQITQSNTVIVQRQTYDPGYRIFQSFIGDCRRSLARPCPITNCPAADDESHYNLPGAMADPEHEASCPPPEEQVLNLTALTLRADSSGELANLLPDPPPVTTVPAWLRADESFPGVIPKTRVKNVGYQFYSLWAISDVLITDVFDLVLDVDRFRLNASGEIISDDPSAVILSKDATDAERLAEVSDRSNVVIHNRETYNTVARYREDAARSPSDPASYIDRKNGVIIDAGIGSKAAGGYQWSAVTTGLQTYFANASGYLELAVQQLAELQAHKEEFLCRPFADPDGVLIGPILGTGDCDTLQAELGQIKSKSRTCFAALLKPQQGDSRENCGALFSQIDNMLETLDIVITPPAADEFALLDPNYLGEFESRTRAYRFTTAEWLLPVTPTGGIPGPAVEILQPADGSDFIAGNTITFQAVAEDSSPVVVDLTSSITWESNRDGPLGDGGTVQATLSEGVHIVTASATDAEGNRGVASIVISVTKP